MAPENSEQGFTLVEVLVAFVVSALLLTVIFDGLVSARSREKLGRDKAAAITLASDLLQNKLSGADVDPQGESGTRLHWKLAEDVLGRDPRGYFEFRQITVEVAGASGKELARLEGRMLVEISA